MASELGERAVPLINDLSPLLDHPARGVRFWVLDAVLASATAEHGDIVAQAVELIRDPDEAVRWKALQLLAHARKDRLAAGVPYLRTRSVALLMTWLLGAGNTETDKLDIESRLQDHDRLTRLFAAAAAARLSMDDIGPLERAAASADLEVRSFAQAALDLYRA